MFVSTSAPPVLRDTLPHRFKEAEQRARLGMKTILLAEDNHDLRYGMECILRAMGYLVASCADAQMAAMAFRAHGHIDVLLTDFEMPGRSGVELARELTELCPTLPVMIITGSVLSEATMQEIEDRRWTYVSKPCHLPSLGTRIKEILRPREEAA